ncbi:hypothetical protein JQ310_19670, partial [Leptospira interrogans]|nr:hypothetical protein [Leptospira interrogans]
MSKILSLKRNSYYLFNVISVEEEFSKTHTSIILEFVYKIVIWRNAITKFQKTNPDHPCLIAGAIGPTTKTATLSPDVNNPAFRAVTFDDLVATFY